MSDQQDCSTRLIDVSSTPFVLFLSARLTRSWLQFLVSSSRSLYIYIYIYMELSGIRRHIAVEKIQDFYNTIQLVV
jgi:hypothetical protein